MQLGNKIEEVDNLYHIIGCSKNATSEQILIEYRLKALSLHPDKIVQQSDGASNNADDLHERFQRLQFAKDVLMNPKKRAHYNLWIENYCSEFSLKEWMDGQDKIQQTLHWGHQKEQPQLLFPFGTTNASADGAQSNSQFCWESRNSPTTKAFRDYRL